MMIHSITTTSSMVVMKLFLFVGLFYSQTTTTTKVVVSGYKICPIEQGGGICPDYDTCCSTGTPGISSCISSKANEPAVCCMDDSSDSGSGSDSGVSGCPNGYECRSRNFIENDDNISTINNGDDDDDDDDHDQQPQNSIMTLSNKKHLRFNNNHDYNQHNHNNNNNTDATNLKSLFFCYRTDPEYDGEKPLPLILPRYKLTAVAHETFTRVYGLALLQERSSGNIATSSNSDNNENYMRLAVSNKNSSNSSDNDDDDDNDDAHVNNDTVVNVAYFSSMGSLDSNHVPDLQRHQRVTTVLIVVHGSGRTAEDYLYGAMSSLPTTAATATKTQTDQQDSIMVLSPWFLDRDDDTMVSNNNSNNNNNNSSSSSSSSSSSNDTIPIPLPPNTLRWYENGPTLYHTWRYGANAIDSSFSSFAVMDALVERLMDDSVRFPSLQRIVITGHSAGGQYVQRWALLSNSPAWRRKAQASTAATATADATADAAARNKYESPISMEDRRILLDKRPFSNRRNIEIRAIPANPRCFAMLDDRRYIRDVTTKNITVFRRPDSDVIAACPDFNEWIWGLQAGGNVTVPYKDRAVADAGGVEALARRYVAERQLIYLAGGADTQIFEDECGSVLQGQTRRERSERYMASLHELYPKEMKTHCRHTRLVAEGIPHDHTLMFQSPAGQKALFGENGCS